MNPKLKSANKYPEDTHLKIIAALLQRGCTYSYTGLYLSIKDIARKNYIKLGNNKAKLFAKYYYQEAKYIIKKDMGLYVIKPL